MTITVKLNGREKLIGPHRLSMVVVWFYWSWVGRLELIERIEG
jgi:hypothetical protein